MINYNNHLMFNRALKENSKNYNRSSLKFPSKQHNTKIHEHNYLAPPKARER